VTSLPEGILQRIERHFCAEYAGVNAMPPRRAAEEIGDENRVREQLTLMEELIGQPSTGKRLLEVGSGIGLLQAVARADGIHAFGVEPEQFNCDLSRAILGHYGFETLRISQAFGEQLPFADDVFDIVCSFLVMEHVHDPRLVLTEAARVLKPGGYMHFVAPNYGSIWEGHYNIPWIPQSPYWLARLYVRLMGRDPSFVDTLQLLTPGQLRRIVADLPLQVKSWGIEVWEYRLETLDFSEWSELRRLKTMVRWARRLHVVEIVRVLGRKLDLFTPIILTAQKNQPGSPGRRSSEGTAIGGCG
jgi:SAM-dependent methyltransferase